MAAAHQAQSAITVEVDMDTITPGIQNTRVGGGAFTADIYIVMGAGDSLTDYSVSVRADSSELNFAGASIEAAVPAPLTLPLDPAALTDTLNFVPGSHQTASFDAGSFGFATLAGPSTTLIGTMSFNVTTPINDGLPDVIPAFWVTGVDGIIDGPLTPSVTFRSGFVIPEPTAASMLLGLTGLLFLGRRRS